MNGKPGDDPATDIVHYGRPVYSPEVDALVLELAQLMDFRRLQDLLSSLGRLSAEEVGSKLKETVAKLKADGRAGGWEID